MNAGQHHRIRLPDFLIIGAQKAGTTSLFDILKQHSKIYLHPKKELHFFDRDQDFQNGRDFYSSYFVDAGDDQVAGEATPIYLFLPGVPLRIREMLGADIKIIIILRNPADRAFSHFKMEVAAGREKRSFEEAIGENIRRLKSGFDHNILTSYLDRGFYASQLENYLKAFSKEQIRVYLFEHDFLDNRQQMIGDIQDFLNLDHEDISTLVKSVPESKPKNRQLDQVLNTGHPFNRLAKRVIPSKKMRDFIKLKMNGLNTAKPTMDVDWDVWRQRLIREVFYQDIKKTETLTGHDLRRWYRDLSE